MRYAIVKDGVILNIIKWSGTTTWAPPEGAVAHAFDGIASPGWAWNDGAPIDPNPPPPED